MEPFHVITQQMVHEAWGSSQSGETRSQEQSMINRKKKKQHLEMEQTESMDGLRPLGLLDFQTKHLLNHGSGESRD